MQKVGWRRVGLFRLWNRGKVGKRRVWASNNAIKLGRRYLYLAKRWPRQAGFWFNAVADE